MKSTLKAKLQHVYSKIHSMFALTLFVFFISWIPASQAACSVHDHFCSYHVGDATVKAGAAASTGTSLVMYAIGTNPGTTTASTVDFDVLGKVPANTGDRFLVGSPINYTTPTGPYIVNSTAYGTTHPPTTWSTPGDAVLQVAPSQYQLTFNQNTAIAKHTGDFNGGENGNIPGATGCPNMPAGTKNCEAVVVTGNVPNGIYEQKVTLFNYFNAPNPQVQLQVGAYTTGRAVIISNSHESTEQAYFPILSGTGATTPAYQYEVYNLGFDPHAKGTALFDQNKYSTRYSNTYEAGDHRFRDAYFTTLTTHNKVNADGWNDKTYTAKTSVEKQYMGEVPKPPVPTVFCTDGKSSISCGTPGAVEYGSVKGRALENAYATLWADQAQKQAAMDSAKEFSKLTSSEKASINRKQSLELVADTIAKWDANGNYVASGLGVAVLGYGILEDKVLSSFSGQPKSLADYDRYYQQKGGVKARSEFAIGLMNIVPNTADALVGGGIYISQVADAKWNGKSWNEANTQGVKGMETMPKFTNGWNQFTSEYLGADKNSAGQQWGSAVGNDALILVGGAKTLESYRAAGSQKTTTNTSPPAEGAKPFETSNQKLLEAPKTTPGSPARRDLSDFSKLEQRVITEALNKHQNGTTALVKPYENRNDLLPGSTGVNSPYVELRVQKTGNGNVNRIVIDEKTGDIFYSNTHYGDTGTPAFYQIK